MNRKELAAVIAEKTGMSLKDVDTVVSKLVDEIQVQLASGEPIKIQGLGTFDVKERAARTARNIASRTAVMIPPRRSPSFKPSKMLKERVE